MAAEGPGLSPLGCLSFDLTHKESHVPLLNQEGWCGSLVGKPRGKATDPLIHAKRSLTLLLQLGRKAHVHALLETRTDSPGETPEVPQDPCQHCYTVTALLPVQEVKFLLKCTSPP